jgi:hypothetical protein
VVSVPCSRSVRRIAHAAAVARSSWPGPLKNSRSASPPNLEEHAAARRGLPEQPHEALVDDVGDVFGADSAEARESLGHLGEAGDVDEHDGSVDATVPVARGTGRGPRARRFGDERREHGFIAPTRRSGVRNRPQRSVHDAASDARSGFDLGYSPAEAV